MSREHVDAGACVWRVCVVHVELDLPHVVMPVVTLLILYYSTATSGVLISHDWRSPLTSFHGLMCNQFDEFPFIGVDDATADVSVLHFKWLRRPPFAH